MRRILLVAMYGISGSVCIVGVSGIASIACLAGWDELKKNCDLFSYVVYSCRSILPTRKYRAIYTMRQVRKKNLRSIAGINKGGVSLK